MINKLYTLNDKIEAKVTYSNTEKKVFYNNYSVIWYKNDATSEVIYTGRVCIWEEKQDVSIYLNDILGKIKPEWMVDAYEYLTYKKQYEDDSEGRFTAKNIKVAFDSYEDDGKTIEIEAISFDILPIYQDLRHSNVSILNTPALINRIDGYYYNETTKAFENYLTPRFPCTLQNRDDFRISICTPIDTKGKYAEEVLFPDYTYSTSKSIPSDYISFELLDIKVGEVTDKGEDYIGEDCDVYVYLSEYQIKSLIHYIDGMCSMSKYYLLWFDRLGGTQCQPFGCKNIESETLTSTNKRDKFDTESPIRIKGDTTIELNTNWLTDKEIEGFEPLFVSPAVALYDSKEDKFYNVRVQDKTFTYKTFKNQGRKLNNMKVKVKLAETENIVY